MVVVPEQDFELVVPVLVPVLCLDLFDQRGENGSVVLLFVMGRDILPVRARKVLGVKSVICDLQPFKFRRSAYFMVWLTTFAAAEFREDKLSRG